MPCLYRQPEVRRLAYSKSKRAYRYYVSSDVLRTGSTTNSNVAVRRISASRIETLVSASLSRIFGLPEKCDWADVEASLQQVNVGPTSVELILRGAEDLDIDELTARAAGWAVVDRHKGQTKCTVSAQSILRGGRTLLIGPNGGHALQETRQDPKLVDALKSAHSWQVKLNASPLAVPDTLAKAEVHPDSYIRRLSRIAFLAPDIQRAILDGRQPAGLTIKKLLGTNLPLDWGQQRKLLGFHQTN